MLVAAQCCHRRLDPPEFESLHEGLSLTIAMWTMGIQLGPTSEAAMNILIDMALVRAGGPYFRVRFPFPFRNCGCPALAIFARAGTMLPIA